MTEPIKSAGPATLYTHKGHIIHNINEEFQKSLTLGQRVADRVVKIVGSWPFIIYQSFIIILWMVTNVYLAYKGLTDKGFFAAWDPYPFILLNLVLSFQAAYTGPVVMMSQNRQSDKDRLMAEHDYHVNLKAEEEITVIMQHLTYQDKMMHELTERLDKLTTALAEQGGARHDKSDE